MQKISLILGLFFVCANVFAQEIALESARDSLKFYKRNFSKGELFFKNKNYPLAISYLEKAKKVDSADSRINFMLGISYLYSANAPKAVENFENTYQKEPEISPDMDFFLALAYQNNYQFAKAKQFYSQYLPKTDSAQQIVIKKYMQECENGLQIIQDTLDVEIVNLGDSINSPHDEYAAYILPADTLMIFTSKRPQNIGGYTNPYDGDYYEDLFFAPKQGENFRKSYNPGRPLNTENPDAITGISPDGSKIYLYADINSGDIFSVAPANNWQEGYLRSINTEFQETGIAFAENGKIAYFVSDRTGTIGGKDIFFARQTPDSTYSKAQNPGENVNSPYDEEAIYISEGNDSLYFSSRGHNTIGGFDVFLSVKDKNGNWGKAQNAGYPINTPYDDMYFRPYREKKAYYSSVHPDTRGKHDIYMVVPVEKEDLPQIAETEKLEAKEVFAQVPDFLVIYNIRFEYNQYKNPEILPMLDKLANFLKNNPETRIEIGGYTDSIGSQTYNSRLAQKRADYVSNYLKNKGVAQKQLLVKAYGEKHPVSAHKTARFKDYHASQSYNRRVEFKVLSAGANIEIHPVEVPEKFRTKNAKISPSGQKTYSVMLTGGLKKRNISEFGVASVQEYEHKGNYFYYFGEFKTLKKAQEALKNVENKFSDAYIFENQ